MTTDRRPLLAYMRVQEAWEKDLLHILSRAAEAASRDMRRLGLKSGIGAAIRADQAKAARHALLRRQAELWRLIGSSVMAGRKEAAAAAIATMDQYDKMLFRAVKDPLARMALQEAELHRADRSIQNVVSRVLGLSDISLSRQVYTSEAIANGWMDRIIENALAQGKSARELAAEVKNFISPRTPGGVKYAAQRLGRTELNNAFHATTVRLAQENPYVLGMKWNVSSSHPKPDECDEYSGQVFEPSEVPRKPHPQCFCFLTPETPDRATFIKNLVRGDYG